MLLVERLPGDYWFNVASVGVGPGVECFPDYRWANKANKELAVYFLKVRAVKLVLCIIKGVAEEVPKILSIQ